jgi:site-specific DNA-cytosine methylase
MSAIPINGMTLNKELRDKQMTGVGEQGDPMFAVRADGQQHAVAIAIQGAATRENPASGPDGVGVRTDNVAYTLEARQEVQAVAFAENSRAEVRLCGGDGSVSAQLTTGGGKPGQGQPCVYAFQPRIARNGRGDMGDMANALNASSGETGKGDAAPCVASAMAVRRLTPRECERLQGFPDDHTLIPWRGKSPQDCPDGPRYKALGNSMAVPCMAWIGKRIAAQHEGKVRYLSVCSGIEAASVAWEPLGWEPAAFAEVEKFPSAVLAHHWPQVPNLGDMTRHESWNLGAIDLLVGGTPCQSFSVAGLRKGLHDPRGGLMLTFLEIAQRQRPRWIVWENVPGVLSSHGGRDFGAFLGALGALGYGFAYRVLDAQWFGVAQRRRRVFVVGCLGDAAAAATVLFESESVCRNPAPSREKGQGVAHSTAPSLMASGRGVERTGESRGQDPVVATCAPLLSPVLTAHPGGSKRMNASDEAFIAEVGGWPKSVADTLTCAYADKQGLEDQHVNSGCGLFVPDVANAITARDAKHPNVSGGQYNIVGSGIVEESA